MRHLLSPSNDTNLVQGAYVWREAAVDAEDPAIDDGGEVEVVEDLTACLPYVCVAVLVLALVVEAVHLGDLT